MSATLVRSHHNHVAVTVSLGDLLHVHPQQPWHAAEVEFRLQFQRGTIEIPRHSLIALVRAGQEALAAPACDVDVSGAAANLGDLS